MNNLNPISAISTYFKKITNFFDKDSPKNTTPKIYKRRRGTVIVDTSEGILVVSGKKQSFFLLPGGGANQYETRKQAAIRELEEETGLKASSAIYLFSHVGDAYEFRGTRKRNHHKVFLAKANGSPKPTNEIKYIKYYKLGDEIKLSRNTKEIIEKYLMSKNTTDRLK